jgi:D-glycero-D-manno-heptose 1,7-bisphosphate phosphatase
VTLGKVVFLDRDGVINYDSEDYVRSWAEYRFLPGSLDALAALTAAQYRLIVITNQSIIGRGMVSLEKLEDIHRRMLAAVAAAGGRIDDIFFCPHRPDEDCACRKPRPGLILQAGQRHRIDLATAIMIGDNAKDIVCGRNAGCGATILVRTGCGAAAEKELAAAGIEPTAVAADLFDAAGMILSGRVAACGCRPVNGHR